MLSSVVKHREDRYVLSLSLHGLTYEDIHRLCSGCTFPQLSFPPPLCVALCQTMNGGHFFFFFKHFFHIPSFFSPSASDFQSERAQRHSRFCLQSFSHKRIQSSKTPLSLSLSLSLCLSSPSGVNPSILYRMIAITLCPPCLLLLPMITSHPTEWRCRCLRLPWC